MINTDRQDGDKHAAACIEIWFSTSTQNYCNRRRHAIKEQKKSAYTNIKRSVESRIAQNHSVQKLAYQQNSAFINKNVNNVHYNYLIN